MNEVWEVRFADGSVWMRVSYEGVAIAIALREEASLGPMFVVRVA